jgi:hypothetical protein
VGLFKKKPIISVCEMCGNADSEGCGSAKNHIEQITAGQPLWLPASLRAQALGEYSWLCVRCNAYPAMKWPGDGGAWSGMALHLGKAHGVGQFAGMGGGLPAVEMLPVR